MSLAQEQERARPRRKDARERYARRLKSKHAKRSDGAAWSKNAPIKFFREKILDRKLLSAGELAVYIHAFLYSSDTRPHVPPADRGLSFPKRATVAENTGYSAKEISDFRTSLVKKELLVKTNRRAAKKIPVFQVPVPDVLQTTPLPWALRLALYKLNSTDLRFLFFILVREGWSKPAQCYFVERDGALRIAKDIGISPSEAHHSLARMYEQGFWEWGKIFGRRVLLFTLDGCPPPNERYVKRQTVFDVIRGALSTYARRTKR